MLNTHPHWHQADNFLLAYGSLMSSDSRIRYSQNPHQAVSVTVQGFKRSWITRAIHEQQTYVGVFPEKNTQLNAHCIPIAINPDLQQREVDYKFVEVDINQVILDGCNHEHLWQYAEAKETKLWICQSLCSFSANKEYPINQSYVDTCLSGCLNHYRQGGSINERGHHEARRFIETTDGWQNLVNDRGSKRYPRAGHLCADEQAVIDVLLTEFGV